MGASSVTGKGPGSAENGLRGLSLENIHKVLNKNENRSFGKYIDNELKFKTTELGEENLTEALIATLPLIHIDWYDTKNTNRIIQLSGNQGLQIEIWKYNRHKKGVHPGINSYPDHIGKRYKPFLLLPFGETQWVISTQWFKKKANWFKFAVFIPASNGEPLKRGPLSVQTIRTQATQTPYEIVLFG